MDYDQTERPPSQGIILNHVLGQAKSSAASGPDISEKKLYLLARPHRCESEHSYKKYGAHL